MAHTYLALRVHLVWGTRRREPLIDAVWRPRLWAYTSSMIKERGGRLIAAGGIADHVHLYVELPAAVTVSDLVREIKSRTTRWVHESVAHRRDFAWQRGFAAFSVSPYDDARLRAYIRDQELHHREVSFEVEYVELVSRCGLKVDAAIALQ